MSAGLADSLLHRGDPGYEAARRAAVWNARTPDRHPDCIALARREDDVVAAVCHAREAGWKIGVRSGGHSWSGSHVRDGGMLLDVSRLAAVTVDAEGMSATAQPGAIGADLERRLEAQDRFFPVGHCPGVALGGYLLQGGYGWNSRALGPACMSVTAIDVVTADGELVRADAERHADLFWAARGSGPGFFGAVTRFHLRLHRRPPVLMNSTTIYPVDVLDEVILWARDVGPWVSRATEMMVVLHRDWMGLAGTTLAVVGPTYAGSEEDAREALAVLESCPVRDRALLAAAPEPARTADLVAAVGASYPDGHRYAVDNVWTHASGADLLPGVRRIAETMPPDPSHMLWLNWGPSPARPDMAYSLEDDVYIAVYGISDDRARDDEMAAWAADRMRELEPLATGIQLADENLGRRPARFVSDANLARLDAVRAAYDPDGRFHPWLGRP